MWTLLAFSVELYPLGIMCIGLTSFLLLLCRLSSKIDFMRFYLSGYKQKDGASKENFNDTCEICRPGTFGGHPSRSTCKPCRGGVVCLEGQTLISSASPRITSFFLQF